MINGQIGIDGGDNNAAHGIGLRQHRQVLAVALVLGGVFVIGGGPSVFHTDLAQLRVVRLRLVPRGVQYLRRGLLFQLGVFLRGAGLGVVVPLRGHDGVEQDTKADENQDQRDDGVVVGAFFLGCVGVFRWFLLAHCVLPVWGLLRCVLVLAWG